MTDVSVCVIDISMRRVAVALRYSVLLAELLLYFERWL